MGGAGSALKADQQAGLYEYLTIDDGLSDSFITHILQDHSGYFWFGTMDGLNRYNGESIEVFRNRPGDLNSLSDNHVKGFDQDKNGTLYIATNAGGLNCLDVQTETIKRCRLVDAAGKSFKALTTVRCGHDGIIWVGTQNGILLAYNSRLDSVESIIPVPKDHPNKSSNFISDLYLDDPDKIWIASGLGGLDLLDLNLGTYQHILQADPLQESFRRSGCGGIVRDAAGTLWISRVSGLDSYDPLSGKHQHFGFLDSKQEMLKAFNLVLDEQGKIILSSYYDLIKFNPADASHELLAGILPQYFTSALYRDRTGIIWAGTMGYGVIKLDPRKWQFNTSSGNYLYDLFPDELSLLADSYGVAGLNLRDRDFLSVLRDKRGDLWVATQFWGLYRIDHKTRAVQKYSMGEPDVRQRYRVIYEVFEDHQGEIWVSTSGGLCKLDRLSGEFQFRRLYPEQGYPDNERAHFALNKTGYLDISCINQDQQGVFWLGTPELGLIRFDPDLDSISYHPVSYSGDLAGRSFTVLGILEAREDPKHFLWLGTEGGGLVRFDKKTHETSFITMQDGLPNNTINSILPGADSDLWISTNLGLSHYEPAAGKVENYTVQDGLQSNGFNRREGYKTDRGELYFGGTYGYNHFFPEDISESDHSAPIVLTGIDLLNEAVVYSDQSSCITDPIPQLREVILNHQQAMMITLYFTALNYSNNHRDQFVYKLDGFDGRWIMNGSLGLAVYTNLDPGNYRFRVRYLGEENAQNPHELALDLTVLPPFWLTWWFKTGSGGLIILLIALVLRQNFLRLEAKRLQQQHFSQQLLEYQEQERKRISGELHDGIGQDLLIIKNTLQLGLNSIPEKMQCAEYFTAASQTVSQTIQEVREISHNLSPQYLDQLGLTSTIESALEAIENSGNIIIKATLDDIDDLIPRDMEIMLYRIVQESLNNIIKHSQATELRFELTRSADQITLEICDNGIGISNAQVEQRKGIGLAGMHERARLLQGHLAVKPGNQGGTVVSLVLNLKNYRDEMNG